MMKHYSKNISSCIECPGITEDMLFCTESFDVWRGMPTLRKIQDPGKIQNFCPLPDVKDEEGVKDIG